MSFFRLGVLFFLTMVFFNLSGCGGGGGGSTTPTPPTPTPAATWDNTNWDQSTWQ